MPRTLETPASAVLGAQRSVSRNVGGGRADGGRIPPSPRAPRGANHELVYSVENSPGRPFSCGMVAARRGGNCPANDWQLW
jgi:hypothetical protein